MSEVPFIVFTTLLILLYGLFSKKILEKTIITAPMIFKLVGILVASYPIKALEEGINA